MSKRPTLIYSAHYQVVLGGGIAFIKKAEKTKL